MKILIREERRAEGEEAEDSISTEEQQPRASLFTQISTLALNKVQAEEEDDEGEEQEKEEKDHAQQCKDLDWFISFWE